MITSRRFSAEIRIMECLKLGNGIGSFVISLTLDLTPDFYQAGIIPVNPVFTCRRVVFSM